MERLISYYAKLAHINYNSLGISLVCSQSKKKTFLPVLSHYDDGLNYNDKQAAASYKKNHLVQDQNAHTLFHTKMAQTPYPLAPHDTYLMEYTTSSPTPHPARDTTKPLNDFIENPALEKSDPSKDKSLRTQTPRKIRSR